MDQRAGDVSLLDGSRQRLFLAAAHARDEIGEVIVARMATRARPPIAAEPALVAERVFVACGEVSVRSVKNVADRVMAIEEAPANAGLVVGDPVPYLDLHHLAAAVRSVKFEDAAECVRRFLIVIEHEVTADRRHAVRERDTEAPARHIYLVDCLVAKIAIARVPDPMPVVMKPIVGERLHRRWAGPEVVVEARRNRFGRRPANRVPPLEAESPSQIDLAEGPAVQMLDRLDQRARRTALRTMLHDALVFLGGANDLTPLPQIV